MDCNDVLTMLCRMTCNNSACKLAGRTYNMLVCSINEYSTQLEIFGSSEDDYCTECNSLGVLEKPCGICFEYVETDHAPYYVMLRFTPQHIETLIRLVRNHADGDAPNEEIVRLAIDDDLNMHDAFYFAHHYFTICPDGTYDIVTKSDCYEANKIIGVCNEGAYFQADLQRNNEDAQYRTYRSGIFDLQDLFALQNKMHIITRQGFSARSADGDAND